MKFELGKISQIFVIHIELRSDNVFYHFLILNYVKDDVTLGNRGEMYKDVKEVLKNNKNGSPIALHFSGKGILNRSVTNNENYRKKILLNGNIDNFYFTDVLDDKTIYSSIIRQDVADKFIEHFKKEKGIVVSISSGPFITVNLSQTLQLKSIYNQGYLIEFNESFKIRFFEKNDEAKKGNLKLENDSVSYNLIPAASVGLNFFYSNEQFQLPEFSEKLGNIEESKQKKIFKLFSYFLLLLFFGVLAGNYFYLSFLNQKVIDNSSYLLAYDSQLETIAKLKSEKERKETLLTSSGISSSEFLSFYLMEIGNSIPVEILLNEIDIKPISKGIKDKEKITFDDKKVIILGKCKGSEILNNWIEELELKKWIYQVNIVDYELNKNIGDFHVELKLK